MDKQTVYILYSGYNGMYEDQDRYVVSVHRTYEGAIKEAEGYMERPWKETEGCNDVMVYDPDPEPSWGEIVGWYYAVEAQTVVD